MESENVIWKREPFTEEELNLVIDTLIYERDKNGSFYIQTANVEKVKEILEEQARQGYVGKCYIQGNFAGIVSYDVAIPWWTEEEALIENLVLCVNPYYAGFGRRACDFMEQLAQNFHVKHIIAGCLFQDNPQMITNLYKKRGYMTVNPLYIKTLEE